MVGTDLQRRFTILYKTANCIIVVNISLYSDMLMGVSVSGQIWMETQGIIGWSSFIVHVCYFPSLAVYEPYNYIYKAIKKVYTWLEGR